MLLNNAHWSMPVTENPVLDSTEIWELVNTTDDSHPIHLHLVRFQILDRRSFDVDAYWDTGQLKYKAPRRAAGSERNRDGRIRSARIPAW